MHQSHHPSPHVFIRKPLKSLLERQNPNNDLFEVGNGVLEVSVRCLGCRDVEQKMLRQSVNHDPVAMNDVVSLTSPTSQLGYQLLKLRALGFGEDCLSGSAEDGNSCRQTLNGTQCSHGGIIAEMANRIGCRHSRITGDGAKHLRHLVFYAGPGGRNCSNLYGVLGALLNATCAS